MWKCQNIIRSMVGQLLTCIISMYNSCTAKIHLVGNAETILHHARPCDWNNISLACRKVCVSVPDRLFVPMSESLSLLSFSHSSKESVKRLQLKWHVNTFLPQALFVSNIMSPVCFGSCLRSDDQPPWPLHETAHQSDTLLSSLASKNRDFSGESSSPD